MAQNAGFSGSAFDSKCVTFLGQPDQDDGALRTLGENIRVAVLVLEGVVSRSGHAMDSKESNIAW